MLLTMDSADTPPQCLFVRESLKRSNAVWQILEVKYRKLIKEYK